MSLAKLDSPPSIDNVIKMSEIFKKSGVKTDLKPYWNLDQKADFYLGMFAAMRVFQSAIVNLERDPNKDLGDLNHECALRLGEISNIIIDKYQLQGF